MQYQCNMQEEPGDCHQPHNPARTGSEPTENTTGESKVNLPVFPVYHFLVSAAILVFVVIFWRTHHRDHRNWLALRLFVLCSVNRWPLRMVKGTPGGGGGWGGVVRLRSGPRSVAPGGGFCPVRRAPGGVGAGLSVPLARVPRACPRPRGRPPVRAASAAVFRLCVPFRGGRGFRRGRGRTFGVAAPVRVGAPPRRGVVV